ncbi:hypothetical protein EUU23_10380 [Sphingorhabdus sp. IMCC26285]|uniref:PDZ domain-containing protein n=1 Tax=Sphingorhabdus profundilacus TaxID=2509718 RepID=A0A6I4M612_9SPHN|nr:hypothetical protein [Sphingorhabdus profundilacus]MVZ98098.1 hypothetical protein [Sphingorhabdus profundilacus]
MSVDRRAFLAVAGSTPIYAKTAWGSTPPFRIPIKLTDTRVLVDCTIGPHGPFSFVFDSGGTIGLIELKLAQQLKLKRLGSSFLGLKQGRKAYPIFIVPDLAFGNTVRQPVSTIAGVDVVNFGEGAVGSIAAGALTAGDCELDFEASEWRIYRDGLPDRSSWTRFPGAIFKYGNVNGSAFIAADAMLEGRMLRFGLDTGMPSAMRIYRKAAEQAGLWDTPRWSPTAPNGKGRMVRATLTLASVTMPDVIVTVIDDPEWDVFPNGVIGLPILRRFNMATASNEQTLFLKSNALPGLPARYNRAGIWIDRAGSDAKIMVVGPGSPAAKAELKAGDRLVGVQFEKLIDRMFEPAGNELALTVERAGTRREVTLQLQDFL